MEHFKLTLSQKSINELQCFYADTSISVICGAVIFEEKLNADILIRAAELIIEKHDALRLRFFTEDGETVQYVSKEHTRPDYLIFDSRQAMREYCQNQAHIPFKANGAEMFRMTVFELPESTGIILCASHLISDAWTYSILANDVYSIYQLLINGENAAFDICSYTEYIEKDRQYVLSDKYKADRAYWAEKYSGCFEKTPIRICRKCNTSAAAKRFSSSLSSDLCSEIEGFCSKNNVSAAALFETAVIIYLAKINSGKQRITVGIPVLGRNNAAEKKTAGMFISTIPLTVEMNENDSVLSIMRKTTETKREIFRHRRFPYSELLREIRKNSSFTDHLFDVMVSCQNGRTNLKAATEWFSNGYSELPFAVHFDDRDGLDRYTITIDYQTDVFPQDEEIRLSFDRIVHIIRQMISHCDAAISDISVLPENERKMLIHSFNNTAVPFPEKCVHEAFSDIAQKHPNETALVFRNQNFSYGQLDKMSDALALYLRDNGIKNNDIVPIISVRSPYIIIAMLAVLKAGGAYMPVSPDYPDDRIQNMLESVSAKHSLTYGYRSNIISGTDLGSFDYSYTSEVRFEKTAPDDICYVIFTSGSTGTPKAAAVTHRNVMNYCAANQFNIMGKVITDTDSNIVSVTNFVFDIFVTESILSLLNKITIYLADDEQTLSQKALSALVRSSGADIIQTTPAKMRSLMLDRNNLHYLSGFKKIILGGEELTAEFCRELKKHTSADIYNIYGPAETTVWSTVAPADRNDITIGKPIANTHVYVLDDKQQLLPVGTLGEICISGAGVSSGYLNSPELTAERFLPDPFFPNEIMYRTGDMGLFRADGNIEFFGRKDNQIKLRGLRIELGEIESVLGSFDGVQHSAAVCRTDKKGEKFLAGYYTSEKAVDDKLLHLHLSRKLPSYMVPRVFIRLSEMPMTPSGKIDRKNLPPIELTEAKEAFGSNFTPPSNEKEETLCALMAKVLDISRVGTQDDFFELGGDSFLAMEFTALAQEHGIYFPVRRVYECRTVKKLYLSLFKEEYKKDSRKTLSKYPQKRTTECRALFSAFVKLTNILYKFDVDGLDKLNMNERYIFCPNHESDLDCMWVLAALCREADIDDTCALIAAEHLDDPLHDLFFRISGGIPIERKGDFLPSLNRAVNVIKRSKRFLLIHPEGTRTRNGRLGELKKGAALISIKTNVKLVPVYIEGAREIYPVYRKLPFLFDIKKMRRYPLHISFGTPIAPAEKSTEQITEELRSQIIKLRRKILGNRNRR